ncbi:MAG: YdcH family protein [Oceanospirillaceae bacterium]
MSLQKHDLLHELPEYRDSIHELKMNDRHFAKLFDKYHEIDHEVHRIEQGVETPSDEYIEQQKKQRLHLKDQLHTMLVKHSA